jgi:CheY-like chemotaxis protein
MLELEKPRWLNASLPYLFVVAGLVTLVTLQHAASLFSACLLLVTGLYALDLRRIKRRDTNRPSVTGSFVNRDKSLPKPSAKESLQVVVIEDNEATLRLYQIRLEAWGFPVTLHSALNGYEGLVLVGEILPDLLICDLRMPEVDGVQIISALCDLERYKNMAIVMVTGLPFTSIDARGGLPDRVEKLGKPIDFDRLKNTAQGIWARKTGA